MANFLIEFAGSDTTTPNWWNLYVEGASNVKGSGVGFILEGPNNVTQEQALKLNFRALNNQVECEVLIVGLKLAREVKAN